mgnify:CR=1 FL=1|tara:strand:- start:772 stop:1308 length:537 start_codon:yes stop_codon:yes gene_type:complete
MKINSDLQEATVLKSNTLSDVRGYLTPLTDEIETSLINRVCLVGNFARGVKRGIHYHEKEWKIYSVVTGAAKFISLKLSPTFWKENDFSGMPVELAEQQLARSIEEQIERDSSIIKTTVISARSPAVFVIPNEHANGWISLEENTNIVFLSNLAFEEAKEDDYRFSPQIVSDSYWRIG